MIDRTGLQLLADIGLCCARGGGMDVRDVLTSIAETCAASMADWCAIYVFDGQPMRQLAVAHRQPEKAELVRSIYARWSLPPGVLEGFEGVLRSGTSQLTATITDDQHVAVACDAEHLASLRELAVRSSITTPLMAGGTAFGAIVLARAGQRPEFDERDVKLAEEVALRVAFTVRNTRTLDAALAEGTSGHGAKNRAEEGLRAAEERFRHLVDAVTDYAIFILDETGLVETWSPGVEKIKGYRREEVVGRHFSIFYTDDDRAAGKPERVLETVRREGRFEEEGWRVRKDRSRFWANVVITALRDESGHITGFAKVTRDLTERRAAEENAQRLAREQFARAGAEAVQREMERVNRAKDEFLATMSHELRTPLNAINGWVTILRKKPRDEDKLERGLEVIERNAKAQTRLVSDLMDVSRIISGKLQIALLKTEVLPIVFAAADVVRPAAEAKGVRLVVDVDPDIGSILGDADRLQQVVWNLLSNAVRFTPRGGRVTVSADRQASGVIIRVQDTGEGIAPEHVRHVFERFMQVDASTSRAHGGLGLGLSIVRHLVEAHGGTVQAHSEGLGLGAAFTVSLPIRAVNKVSAEAESDARVEAEVKASPGVKAEADDTATHASLRGVRILVVDDDRDSLSVLREVLGSAGAEVTTASSAGEAFEVIERGDAFELIVSDIGMPGMDGYAFIRQVRSRAAGGDTPAIALTAYARPSDAELAKRAGFQEHLTKPVDERELLRAARTLSQA